MRFMNGRVRPFGAEPKEGATAADAATGASDSTGSLGGTMDTRGVVLARARGGAEAGQGVGVVTCGLPS